MEGWDSAGPAEDEERARLATTPLETMSVKITTATIAFLERIALGRGRSYDEDLSKRSDKSIYEENRVFIGLQSS